MENLDKVLKRLQQTRIANSNGSDRPNVPTYEDATAEEPCDICKGRRWLVSDAPVGHPDFGRMRSCECNSETDPAARSNRLRRYSNLGPLSRMTFASADQEGRSDDPVSKRLFTEAYAAALAYSELPSGWLVLTGPNGSGKTHLAAAIANHCIEQGRPIFFVHVPDLLDDLRNTYSPTSDASYSELFERVNDAPLLILDGLGAQSQTPWAQEKLQQIFNRRANSQMPTVVTTVLDIGDIDPYIASRMQNRDLSRILQLGGASRGPMLRVGPVPAEMMQSMTFSKFDIRGNRAVMVQRQTLEGALAMSKAWASNPAGWLTLYGDTGVGKTHLAISIAVSRTTQGLPVFFAFVPQLMDYLRHTYRPDSGVDYNHVFDEVRNTPMLILDDLGSEYRNQWAYEKLYQIIVFRHNLRLPTVITTSLDVTDISGPIVSRLQDPSGGYLIRMDAPDFRVKRRDRNRQGTPERDPRWRGAR